ncbi:hypothetical protein, partial [Phascolarctobacterium faecium]|uniref:hypothetical protein n=1 Tax=Phascolarctobacterium faecium TaxID=33025 RepID=UPI003AB1677E
GPWSHGEARNGGTPDWILQKKYLKDLISSLFGIISLPEYQRPDAHHRRAALDGNGKSLKLSGIKGAQNIGTDKETKKRV